jgi:hypothetical protein
MAWAEVADGIDATGDPAQLPPCDTVADSPSSHSKLDELLATNNSVLILGKVPNATVQQTRRTLCLPDMHNVRLAGHGANPDRPQRADGALVRIAREGDSSPPVPPLALIP